MAASKDYQSVPESAEGRSQHDNRVKMPITTDHQYLLYPKDDRGPYNENEAVLGGRKESENLYDYHLMIGDTIFKDGKVTIFNTYFVVRLLI